MKKKYFYLLEVQYLGFRYHGWQKQKDVKTVQGMLDRTLRFILGEVPSFKTLAAGRTDAMVSAEKTYVELFCSHEFNTQNLQYLLDAHLPLDIRVLSIREIDKSFNIINSIKSKEYHYHFCYQERPHPFCAPFLCFIREELSIERMQEAARLFEGEHFFKYYIYQAKPEALHTRVINESIIERVPSRSHPFFPPIFYRYRVIGEGFGRYQVRMMMGQLFRLGMGKLTMQQLQDSLQPGQDSGPEEKFIAPASGLTLHQSIL